jgi:hypothetical protein
MPVTPDFVVATAPASHHDNQPEATNVERTDAVATTDMVADGKIGLDDFLSVEGMVPPLSNKSRRVALAYLFEAVHGGQEDCHQKPWNGKGGVFCHKSRKPWILGPLRTSRAFLRNS